MVLNRGAGLRVRFPEKPETINMTEENVVQLPTRLERLARDLNAYLQRDDSNRADWIEIQEGICLTLAEARSDFTADVEFGQWCSHNGFGEDALDYQTRAAAIKMGRNPGALRACLEATERQSLRTICLREFNRFDNGVKPTTRRKQPRLDLSRPSPEFEKAKVAYDEIKASGETVTVAKVAKLAGVSNTPARIAVAFKQGTEEPRPLRPDEMSGSMTKRYEAAVKKARAEIREELKIEVFKELDVLVQHAKERSERADRILASHQGVMTRDAFRKIRACLHPDHNTFALAGDALQIFSELEDLLVKADEPIGAGPPLPTTAAELMARRHKYQGRRTRASRS